ncbi:xylan 1,4-beta-xylosidase [Catellatospora sp. TT07R-123]|uniref:family 43 glycosylhydrolase n=1 Tax=Catellatospora sp. TT07R-123 TaxID=2733863 RepID=UPI001B2C1162|nr:family 43 glycosylhydrolase [Catellatospora sp. TT07R-123]GHJ48177.1 xylan 1,4-beta-xylosidase [Catellatospora sp. TT07R-123]
MPPNPVLPGSHPDPSIVRVGADFYLATSTFEWYPGVRVHHSRDLAHWTPLGGILDSPRLLDLTGCPDSGGVWAPNLTYADGLFHLVYGNVSTYSGGFTDCVNHLVTAPSIDGPWSDPVLLHARGFDASLFHDGEASWLLNLVHDWRPRHGGSAGLEAIRYDRASRRLVGEPVRLELPPGAGWIEGPNLYRHDGWYYLLTADGGTGYDHQVSVCRSRALAGPYERDPDGPLLTARHRPDWPLQKAGHGSLVQDAAGDWHLAYLVARPQGSRGPCVLGRETALTRVSWSDDGWPTVADGLPSLEAPVLAAAPAEIAGPLEVDGFDGLRLGPQWSTLRRPADPSWVSLGERPSHLRIRGGRSPQSFTGQSLVARRVTGARCSFEAEVDFRPAGHQHVAGITAYYNSRNWHLLYLTADDEGARVLRTATRDRGVLTVHPPTAALPGAEPVRLGLDLRDGELSFRFRDGDRWRPFGARLDATVLSDEHAVEFDGDAIGTLGFTGAFVGLWVWDLNGRGHPADFTATAYEVHP